MRGVMRKRYLVFPIQEDAPPRTVRLLADGRAPETHRIPYDEVSPTAMLYLDLADLLGREVEIRADGVQLRQADCQTVPLLDGSQEPSPAAFGLPADAIVRRDTYYTHYAFWPFFSAWTRRSVRLTANYLTFPICETAPQHLVRIVRNGQCAAEYRLRIAPEQPDFTAFLDLRPWRGEVLELESDCALDPGQAEEISFPDLYREPERPQFHFTVKNGWNNDPNGLIFLDGVYHMFFQYGPGSVHWNNMHWGHAVSRDLVRWEELPCALRPDAAGTIASGSAVLDTANLSGLGSPERPPVLLYFSHTGAGFSQHVAYSDDGLRTLRPYPGSPVLPNLCAGNRDPRVTYCAELGCYVMALYMDRDCYWLFRSPDLLHWEKLQALHLPGDSECPDLYPILDEQGNRKWVFSGAHDVYVVGSFRGGAFEPEQPPQRFSYGNLLYAAQTFSNTWPKVYRVSWAETSNWRCRASQQMGIPVRLRLRRVGGRYRLAAEPVAALTTLYRAQWREENLALRPGRAYTRAVTPGPTDLRLRLAETKRGTLRLSLLGAEVRCDFEKNTLRLGGVEAPLRYGDAPPTLRLLLDRRTAELFADDGMVLAAAELPRLADGGLEIESTAPVLVRSLSCAALGSIWEPEETSYSGADRP